MIASYERVTEWMYSSCLDDDGECRWGFESVVGNVVRTWIVEVEFAKRAKAIRRKFLGCRRNALIFTYQFS